MSKKTMIIEVDEYLVKVCVADGPLEKRKPEKFFMFEIPPGMVQDGTILKTEAFSEILMEQLDSNGCKKIKDVLFTVVSNRVATREVKMPLLSDGKIADVIKSNSSEYFPVDLNKYTIKFRVMMRQKKGDEKFTNVLVLAMPNSLITSYTEVITITKLRLRGLDASCNSMVDGVNYISQADITAFVNVNCSGTYLTFMQGKELLLQRALSFGGDDFLRAYIDSLPESIGYLEAVNQLSGPDASMYLQGKMDEEDISSLFSRIVGGISRSIDYFNTNKSGNISRIVFAGSCGKLYGLQEMVEDTTGITTQDVTQLSAAMQYKNIGISIGHFICTMGAGISKVTFTDFTGSKKVAKKDKGNGPDPALFAALGVMIFIFAAYWGYDAYSRHAQAETELEEAKLEIERLLYLDDIHATYVGYQETMATMLTFVESTENYNEDLLDFIAEFERKMPSEILVFSATCGPTAVSMNIEVTDYVSAATVVSKFRTFESIQVVQVSAISMVENEFGIENASFSIVCNYGVNPYVAGTNPYQAELDTVSGG
ncbi:MAG: pilus assembly protein PilM [Eubacteriales bacterium]